MATDDLPQPAAPRTLMIPVVVPPSPYTDTEAYERELSALLVRTSTLIAALFATGMPEHEIYERLHGLTGGE